MVIKRIDARWWRKLHGQLRKAMVYNILGFGNPKVVLTEYPKSGGTWVCQMIADYLNLPDTRDRLPPLQRCVIKGHYLHVSNAHDTIVMWRDGRDVVVSHYYYHLFHRRKSMPGWTEIQKKRLGIKDVHDIKRYLPRYIEYCFTDGPPTDMTWVSFIETWKNKTGYIETSYEEMRRCPESEMKKILQYLSPCEIDDARLSSCISKFSFESLTGRKPGEEDATSFVRKGIVGDWKNNFTLEAREVFDYYAGQFLIELGYETDRSWVRGDTVKTKTNNFT